MPYPSQIDADSILKVARNAIEADGVGNLSLNKLAAAMGVKAASLYRYYDNKAALLKAINQQTIQRLFAALEPALDSSSATIEQLMMGAKLYRAFALDNPQTYGMLFTNTIDDLRPDPEENVRLILPYQQLFADLCGDVNALAALRGYLALLHGYAMLLLADQLRRGGDLQQDYETAVRAYLTGWVANEK
ncbi:MAG: TetR/AcrR family transcriptional regulator [Chloroflexota bacterium]